jgi:hypothetical protein
MKRIIKTLLLIAALVSVSSCMKDISGSQPDKGEAEVLLRLRTSEGYRSTRGLTYTQENTITTVHVLVFRSNTLVDIRQGRDINVKPDSSTPDISGSGTFSVLLPASIDTSDTYDLVVLANAGTLPVGLVNKTYTDVIAALWHDITEKMYQSTKAMAMWGEIKDVYVSENTSDRSVSLTRAVARIDIGVGTARQVTPSGDRTDFEWDGKETTTYGSGNDIPFVLNSVYVMRANKRYALIPGEADKPTIPTGTTAFSVSESRSSFGFTATTSTTGGFSSRDIYVPEINIFRPTTAAEYVANVTDPKPGDANHTNRMAIVVGGYYNGSTTETFYRVDFAPGGELVNVLRNHLYRFDIGRVSGAGLQTPEDAYNSFAMNMVVNIEDWNITDTGEIIFDGPYHVMLQNSRNEDRSDRMAILYREKGSTDRIVFTTGDNLSNSDFVMVEENGWRFPDPDNRTTIVNDRFSVEIKEDNGVRYFEFKTLLPFSATATDNPSFLTVKVKERIQFVITIQQKDADPNDWNNGGNIDLDW